MSTTVIGLIVGVVVLVAFLLGVVRLAANMYLKVGPNRALIVYGAGGMQVVTGGGKFVIPLTQHAQEFSLELMSFDVAPQQNLYTNQGVAVRVEAVTQLKVRSGKDSILTAAEQFLSKNDEDREDLIRLVMEGHLRGIVGQLTVEQLVKEPEMVSEKMRSVSSADLAKMGLEVISFTIKQVLDENDYITNMGRPEIERIKKEANIAAEFAARDTQIQVNQARLEAANSKAQADQERVAAETASQAKQAEYQIDLDTKKASFQRDLALKQAGYDAEVKKQQVVADRATELQQQIQQQQIVQETARAQEIEKTAQVKVQEAEGQRRQMELEATVIKAAEAEKQRVTALAEAEKQRLETLATAQRQTLQLEAEGHAAALRAQAAAEAEAARVRGAADAEAARLVGLAEAEVIRAKGEAEAEAMRVKAAAYHEYNEAAVLDKIISNLPEIVRAMGEPLSKVDKISIVSTGSSNGNGGSNLGASRITGDMVTMLAQAPAILEALTGVRIADLMARVPGLTVESDGAAKNGATSEAGASEASKAETPKAETPAPAAASAPAAAADETVAANGASAPSTGSGSPRQRSRRRSGGTRKRR